MARQVFPALDWAIQRSLQIAIRYLPPRRRGFVMVKHVHRFVSPRKRLWSVRVDSGSSITCDLSDVVQRSIFYRGRYEPELTEALMSELRPGDVFVDVGANVGWYSHMACRRVGPKGRVEAFEPSPALVRRMRSDLQRSGITNVAVHQVAVGDRAARLFLTRNPDDPSPDGEQYLAETPSADCVEVDVVRLDDRLAGATVDVMKIDVEGAELKAIAGMEELLAERPPRLLAIECMDQTLKRFGGSERELVEKVEQLGFVVERFVRGYEAPTILCRPASSDR